MKRAAGLTLTMILLFGLYAFFVPSAWALSCAPPRKPIEELGYSDMVFKGRLVSEAKDRLTFAVSKVWKGEVSETTMLYQNYWTEFTKGEEYIVFAGTSEGRMQPKLCGNTGLAAGFDEQALGESITLAPRRSYWQQALVAIVSGALVVSGAGIYAIKRRIGK
ncbi:hypothetical protein DVH26_34500 [Paenibacillus sp. H1-7]|uniref:hypothetical protein n=1 Tax=Paenibacillus sp. H1-7 TaxID=2282849 RepID=UPI001EF841F1|nr:hypothetical protein [Paenibacillus sp. H1-7]ULL19097.1 hypothetical protein DVH26_34500 [Paenibacillus sp. H1-7]